MSDEDLSRRMEYLMHKFTEEPELVPSAIQLPPAEGASMGTVQRAALEAAERAAQRDAREAADMAARMDSFVAAFRPRPGAEGVAGGSRDPDSEPAFDPSVVNLGGVLWTREQIAEYHNNLRDRVSPTHPFKCRFCPGAYSTREKLDMHKLEHVAGCYECPDCPMEFSYPALLKIHQTTHELPFIYCCKFCNSKFQHESQLNEHMIEFSEGRSFV